MSNFKPICQVQTILNKKIFFFKHTFCMRISCSVNCRINSTCCRTSKTNSSMFSSSPVAFCRSSLVLSHSRNNTCPDTSDFSERFSSVNHSSKPEDGIS